MAKLYIVGTPIGNLKDITLRALETLKCVSVIACEDTRHSLTLLNNYGIKAKLIAYHKFNEAECSQKLIDLIGDGNDVALISDAGMPSISDPGAEVVSRCRAEGVDVELVPGASAITGAIALSGIKASGFTFLGFLPEKLSDKTSIVSKAANAGLPIALYVAPHDLYKTAGWLFSLLGDRKVYVARELTKIHECVTETTLADFQCEAKGEIVLIIENATADNPLNELSVAEHIRHYLDLGETKKDAVKKVASDRGVPKDEIYKQAIDISVN